MLNGGESVTDDTPLPTKDSIIKTITDAKDAARVGFTASGTMGERGRLALFEAAVSIAATRYRCQNGLDLLRQDIKKRETKLERDAVFDASNGSDAKRKFAAAAAVMEDAELCKARMDASEHEARVELCDKLAGLVEAILRGN